MNVLTAVAQQTVEKELVDEGLIDQLQLNLLKDKADQAHQPIFSLLLAEGHINDEQLTKALAKANNVPYVNLTDVHISPKVLQLLPRDISNLYMPVPLGEMQHKLVVAMLDAERPGSGLFEQ